jgi:N-acetyl-anhydromuramyl-L-alanine amidase AmpD
MSSKLIGLAFFLLFGPNFAQAVSIRDASVYSEARAALTRDYARRHYGLDSDRLQNPQLIVVHFTAVNSLKESLNIFQPTRISRSRPELKAHGDLNVGVHFLIDKGGAVYQLLPLEVMGRHAVGYNHCSIGIENVAKGERDLTPAQLRSNAELIAQLKAQFPSVRYLAGHHEVAVRTPRFPTLFIARDASYRPNEKVDPGPRFMRALRRSLSERGLSFE